MPKLMYATSRAAKVASLRRLLEPQGFEIDQVALTMPEPRHDSVERLAMYKGA